MKNKIVGLVLFYSVGAYASLGNHRPWTVQSCATNSVAIRPIITAQAVYERSEYDQQAYEYQQVQNSLHQAAHQEKHAQDKREMICLHEHERSCLLAMQGEHMKNLVDSHTFVKPYVWDTLREQAEVNQINAAKAVYQQEVSALGAQQSKQMESLCRCQRLGTNEWKNLRYFFMESLCAKYKKEEEQYLIRKKNSTDIAVRPYQMRDFQRPFGFGSSSVW
jgi:hypothetical protein